ncbi:hypothetical protein HanRHA438_Chr10g0471101 [Helianthus annuus]|nr:hypothetical protein HanIR_Chr10g0493771 [Helianthus annuus]KAJ0881140.1 hypothetical protein HanRHA438_Chr10g0471101 [Helianthus annuus]
MPRDIRRQQTMCVGLDGIQVPNFNNFTSIQQTKHCFSFILHSLGWGAYVPTPMLVPYVPVKIDL